MQRRVEEIYNEYNFGYRRWIDSEAWREGNLES